MRAKGRSWHEENNVQTWILREAKVEKMKQHKIGLVVEGGGMKCAYNAGILDDFLEEKISFDYCIGVSAGAGNLASYLAGQHGRNLRFFTQHIHSPEYFGVKSLLKTGDLFGLQYIYGTLTRSAGKDPLDYEAILRNPTQYEAVVTNAITGQAEYYGKEMLHQDDYRLLMASSAIPAVCRPVQLHGIPYYDGGLSDAIPVGRALGQGCDRLVVILSKNRDYLRTPQKMRFLYSRICRSYPRVVEAIDHRHETYNRNLQEVFALEKAGKAFVFAPTKAIHMSTYSIREKSARELYELGRQDFATARLALKEFLAP